MTLMAVDQLTTPALIAISAIIIIAILIVVAVCTCNEDGSPEPKKWLPRKSTMDQDLDQSAKNGSPKPFVLDITGETVTNGNGPYVSDSNNHRENGNARVSQANTLGRQLPDLPPVMITHTPPGLVTQDSTGNDDYDHLRMPQSSPSRVNPGYDHCKDSPRRESKPASKGERENIYNLPSGESSDSGSGVITKDVIREPIYELLTGEMSDSGSGVMQGRENVYNEPEERVGRRLMLERDRSKHETINEKVPDSDYTLVKDLDVDPYARISPGKSGRSSSAAKGDKPEHDPYAMINVDRNSFAEIEARKSGSDGVGDVAAGDDGDEYATVAKFSATGRGDDGGNGGDVTPGSPQAPPIPGRQYTDEDVASLWGQESNAVTPDSVGNEMPRLGAMGEPDMPLDDVEPVTEVSYTEVTARECLASVQARQKERLNTHVIRHVKEDSTSTTYETVVENYYSTVDGHSGDGVVSSKGLILDQNSSAWRNSDMSETYAEIGASGGSVKSEGVGGPRENVEGMVFQGGAAAAASDPSPDDQMYAKVKKRSQIVDGASPVDDRSRNRAVISNRRVVKSTPAPLASAESDELLSDFGHRVSGVHVGGDIADPNYESLDEIRHVEEDEADEAVRLRDKVVPFFTGGPPTTETSRPTERRAKSMGHQYEEVLGRNHQETAYDVRKRVLQKHVYEAVVEARK